MPIRQWDPLRELRSMQKEMNRLFDRSHSRLQGELPEDGYWQPPVDIFADANQIVVKMEVPEVRLEDIRIAIEENRLCIEGERRLPEKPNGVEFMRLERSYGPFRRLFDLPGEIARAEIVADCADGVLTIVLPKRRLSRRELPITTEGG